MNVAATATLLFARTVFYLDAGAAIGGGGLTSIFNGTLEVRAAVTIATPLVVGSTLPIDDTATLTVGTGASPRDYTQTGTLNILFSGTTLGSGYGRLNVTGVAHLGGTLNLVMVNGFRPPVPSSYTILTYASRPQMFGSINGLQPGGGVVLSPAYNPTNMTLTASGGGSPGRGRNPPPKDPSSFLIMTDRVLPERKLLPAGRQPEVIPSISPSLRGTVLLPCPETVLDKLFSDFVADRKFLS